MPTQLIKPAVFLSDSTIVRLQDLIATYKDAIALPAEGRWASMSDGQIWLALVVQVSVVGAAGPGDKLSQGMAARKDWYDALVRMSPEQRRAEIHAVLRTYGVRYSMDDLRRCKKTAALVKNLATVIKHGGPRAYIERFSRWSSERTRVDVLIREMAFIKNKGARDLLIGLGLLKDALAFDTRVLNVLEAMGAQLPSDVATSPATYASLEAELIERVCRPAGVSGAVLDRIMFQKYTQILPRAQRAQRAQRALRATADCV